MANKEKILAKIELLLNETNYEPFTDEVFGRIKTLNELKSYIESLQEEPCNSCQGFNDKDKCDELVFTHNCPIVKNPVSIWHDASEKPREGSWVCVNRNGGLTISTFLYDDGKLHNDYIDNELENCKWAYPRDLINVDNICNIGNNLQEEPVSNNYSALLPCIYNRTLEERVKYCKYCSAACEGRVKEPVSEDLEQEIKKG